MKLNILWEKIMHLPNPGKPSYGRSGGLRAGRNTISGLEKKLDEKNRFSCFYMMRNVNLRLGSGGGSGLGNLDLFRISFIPKGILLLQN